MKPLSRKYCLNLAEPTEEDNRSDKQRVMDALPQELGRVSMALSVVRQLYCLCRDAKWKVTVTLCWNGTNWEIVNLEPGDTTGSHYGICADLGSTTLCVRLLNLNTGKVLCQESVYNRQIAFGEDILNRVFYCKDSPEKLEEVRQATIATFRDALAALERRSGLDMAKCAAMTVAGNTTMMHFFLGLEAFGVFASPYAPVDMEFGFFRASDLEIPICGYVYCYPCRANYLGGDIISGMIATGLHRRENISVFLDIGTNGELVVGNRDFLMAGAGAAGPALEGGVVKTGMRAVDGAVSYLKLEDGQFHLTVIGGGEPKGLCGSGIVDMIAQLFLNGKIDFRGKFIPESGDLVEENGELGICYAPGLIFWQSDIDEFLRTKAAANTMVEYMLDAVGIPMDAVDRFYVAGAFGTYLDKESAVTIGLYPDIPRDNIVSAGNSSLDGAQALLLDMDILEELPEILGSMDYVQFGAIADFIDRMRGAMAIPHTDLERYPTVKEELLCRGILKKISGLESSRL